VGYQTLLNIVPRLILITDLGRVSEEVLLEKTEAALSGGVDAVLLRERQLDAARMLALAARLRVLTADAGAQLLIHTQADVALAVGADGVHVSRHDIGMIPQMRDWLESNGCGMVYSASCHDMEELAQATAVGADFALLSPVFVTGSHPGAITLGPEKFQHMAEASGIPVIGLGGINAGNRHLLADYGVAVISALLEAVEPRTTAHALSLHS